MKITKSKLRQIIKEELEGQTLQRYWNAIEKQLNRDFVGKKVRFSDLATTVPDDPTDAVGVVTRVEVGTFGYEGEGDALFFLDGDTIEVFERRGKTIPTPDSEESVMVSAEFTKIFLIP